MPFFSSVVGLPKVRSGRRFSSLCEPDWELFSDGAGTRASTAFDTDETTPPTCPECGESLSRSRDGLLAGFHICENLWGRKAW